DLALVQLTGLLAGTLSSIFLATPLLVDLKMREPAYQAQAERVRARRAKRAAAAQGDASEAVESTDEAALAADLRRERALAAAASVPSRSGKTEARRGRPSGKSSRPTGKRRR